MWLLDSWNPSGEAKIPECLKSEAYASSSEAKVKAHDVWRLVEIIGEKRLDFRLREN
jgi:hypothetical protein